MGIQSPNSAGLQGCLFSTGKTDPGAGNPAGGGDPKGGSDSTGGGKPAAGRGYYLISHPPAASRLNPDSTYTVMWQASESAGQAPVRISLYRNDTLLGPLLLSAKHSGSFGWNLSVSRSLGGYSQGSGTGYRLRVESEGDDYFGSLELTAPVAGAKARGDSALRVAWNHSGNVGTEVGVEFYRDTALVGVPTGYAPAAGGEYPCASVAWPIPPFSPSPSHSIFTGPNPLEEGRRRRFRRWSAMRTSAAPEFPIPGLCPGSPAILLRVGSGPDPPLRRPAAREP